MNPTRIKIISAHQGGFALVVTLSLMILLTVIAVGLLTLSSISLRSSAQGDAMSTARSNARMALMLAIGDLQKQLGPDTRISARADILDEQHPPLLGAWKSWEGTDHETSGNFAGRPKSPGDYQSEKNDRFLGWLVSGNPNNLKSTSNLPATAASSTRIALIGEKTLGTGQTQLQVHLDPVFANKKKGAYAWWIGGENQKARLPRPYEANSNAEWASVSKSHAIADPKAFGMESLISDPAPAAKAISLKQTDFIDQTGSEKASREYFFDLSAVSTGLLTNTATGGWRKDLSLFTEKYDDTPTSGLELFRLTPDDTNPSGARSTSSNVRPSGSLLYPWAGYRAGAAPIDQQGASASWTNLKDYALIYRKFGSSAPFSLTSTPITTASNAYNYMHMVRARPVIARVQWVFSYWGRTAGSQYTPGILVTPVVTIWNPYNTTLTNIGSINFTLGDKNNPSPLPVVFKYEVTSGNPAHKMPDYRSLTTGSVNYPMPPMALETSVPVLKYQISSVPNLKPGATMVFSPNGQDLPSKTRLMEPGYKTNGGHLFLLKVAANSNENIYTSGSSKVIMSAKYNNASLQKGKRAVGVRLVVRPDDLNSGSNASEMEHRISLAEPVADSSEHNLADSPVLSTIANSAYPFLSMTFGTRVGGNLFAPDQSSIPAKGLVQTNPLVSHAATGDMDEAESAIGRDYAGTAHPVNAPMDFSFMKHAAFDELTPSVSPDKSGYIMTGLTPATGLTRCIMAELPAKPLASLAELQNWDMRFGNPVPPFSFNIIGNSDATPLLPPDAVVNSSDASSAANLQHDDSYCANHLLFDDWFLSSIAAGRPGQFGGTASLLESNFTDFAKGTVPLPNRAYKALPEDTARAQQSDSEARALFKERVDHPAAWETIASRLEVEGMFNVNSTSLTAWRALLRHARGQQIPYHNASGGVSLSAKSDHIVNRFSVAGDTEAGTTGASGDFSAASEITGYRKLDEALLDDFARKIVDQVRKRGPFLSLSEFVNRQLSGDKDLAVAGAIQSALNELEKSTDLYADIVGAYDAQNNYSTAISVAGYSFSEAAAGSGIFGLPGWTRQADVLRPLAPILSARDDTFTIRSYGDARDSNGKITARATCEAVVRRTRHYVDPIDNADLADPPTSLVNRTFGRRFEIVSFRWLETNEI